ncbi:MULTISPECIES: hypothetical protein [unclassified Microcoleus]|uniref:hypothetical protein n=2 Tax=unclassified Microcoleus TaxID=2642155 RepID=UPI002FD0929A
MPVPQEKMPVLPEKRLIILPKAATGKMPVPQEKMPVLPEKRLIILPKMSVYPNNLCCGTGILPVRCGTGILPVHDMDSECKLKINQ